jgi:hypothetical protein
MAHKLMSVGHRLVVSLCAPSVLRRFLKSGSRISKALTGDSGRKETSTNGAVALALKDDFVSDSGDPLADTRYELEFCRSFVGKIPG